MAKTAADIMTERVITTTASATVSEVAKLLTRNAISGMPVVGPGEAAGLRTKVIGIITEADYGKADNAGQRDCQLSGGPKHQARTGGQRRGAPGGHREPGGRDCCYGR